MSPGDYGRLGPAQAVAIGAASAQSTAFAAQTYAVRLVSSVACFVKVDGNPTATSSDTLLPPNWPEYFTVNPGQKVAVIQAASAGSLSVTEMTG